MNATLQELERQDALPPRSGLDLEQFEAVSDVITVIRRDLGRPWVVRDLAKQMHYSSDHFTRVFRAVTGHSPRQFIVKARIEEAKNLITMSSHSISRIAALLGYSDVYQFSKQFKEQTGVPPSRFRRSR